MLLCALAACAGGTTSPVEMAAPRPTIQEQSTSLRAPATPFRTVVPGDTLYSIAWESGRDYRELARWNKIPAPYTIVPGQQLRVTPPGSTDKSEVRTAPAKPGKPEPKTASKTSSGKTDKKSPTPAATATSSPKPNAATNTASNKSHSPNAKTAERTKTAGTSAKSKSEPTNRTRAVSGGWSWPTDGKLLNRYSESDSKGIDIAGTRGDPVRAAADGRVVYQGSGLRGYGQLIIVKHSDEFLSAYAHNDRIHVKEGESVKRGQKIADLGSTGTDRAKLHFEIRRHGAPVDPLNYLPKR